MHGKCSHEETEKSLAHVWRKVSSKELHPISMLLKAFDELIVVGFLEVVSTQVSMILIYIFNALGILLALLLS